MTLGEAQSERGNGVDKIHELISRPDPVGSTAWRFPGGRALGQNSPPERCHVAKSSAPFRASLKMTENDRAPDDLLQRLREAGPAELNQLLGKNRRFLDAACARSTLLNPHADRKAAELLIDCPHLLRIYEVRRDLALSPHTPEVHATRFVSGLFWRDLVRASTNVRVRPRVRRAAEQTLSQRLPSLSLGEKVSLARVGGGLLLHALRWEKNPRVLEALLDNPRMTEGVLVPLVTRDTTPGLVLTLVARNRKWGPRYEIRSAICRNPRTPPALAISLLGGLKRTDVRAVAQRRNLAAVVTRKAKEMVGM